MEFRDFDKNKYTLDEVLAKLEQAADENPGYVCRLSVGSDSQTYGKFTYHVTVIVMHIVGKFARVFYWKTKKLSHKNEDLSVHITHETQCTLDVLNAIKDSNLVRRIGQENLSAHIDAGYTGQSRKIVDSCIGWIRAYGFECACKPEAYGATYAADRLTKRKGRRRRKNVEELDRE